VTTSNALRCGGLAAVSLFYSLLAQQAGAGTPAVPGTGGPGIPASQIGAAAGSQYNGSGLTVEAAGREARLRCAFQRLDARATAAGLWVTSTVSGAKGEPFRVIARALGRDQGAPLPTSGTVGTDGKLARFSRQGLIEEYSVSVDGVQQDFVLEHRPPAKGG
jgi:hypothetical protein